MNSLDSNTIYAPLINRLLAEQEELRGCLLRKMNELHRDHLNALTAQLQQQPDDKDWGALLAGSGWPAVDPALKRLLKVEASLVLVEQEMYGVCSDCEEDIQPSLLQEDPARQRCEHCQAKYDKRDQTRQFVVL